VALAGAAVALAGAAVALAGAADALAAELRGENAAASTGFGVGSVVTGRECSRSAIGKARTEEEGSAGAWGLGPLAAPS